MSWRLRTVAVLVAGLLGGLLGASAQAAERWRFVFGDGPVQAGQTLITPDQGYSTERGFGFEPGAELALTLATAGPRAGHRVLAPARPLYFSVDLPEGSYTVTITLGGTTEPSDTTVKAELRRLMLQGVQTTPGQSVTRRFTVHLRTPVIPASGELPAGRVLLKAPRETTEEAWAWDNRLTLEINGHRPVVQSIDIAPAPVPTLFLLGDSTVADQSQEPYASWGQMLPRFFQPTIAVANLAESGETYRDSLQRRRLDKILATLRSGDTVLMQFGHNDQKQLRDGSGSVHSYQDEMRSHVVALRQRGAVPVIVSSVERRFFNADGSLQHTLADHVAAARAVADEMGVAYLDLNALSRQFYAALGPQQASAAFATEAPGRVDPTHHNNYGAWILARLVAQGLRTLGLPVASQLLDDLPPLDPNRPPPPDAIDLVPSPHFSTERPLGDSAAKP